MTSHSNTPMAGTVTIYTTSPTSTMLSYSPSPKSKADIITPAVVVPVIVLAVVILILVVFIWHCLVRRRQTQKSTPMAASNQKEKPQLYLDEVWSELEGSKVPTLWDNTFQNVNHFIGEMPANEVVGSEMDAEQ